MRSLASGTRGTALAWLGGVLALACGTAEEIPAPADGAPRNVVLVTIDTLRADHLSLYGYPRATTPEIDRWLGGGIVYERAYSTDSSTAPSAASFLSGLLPQEHRVRLLHQLLPADVSLVTDHLPDAYETAAIVSNAVLADEAIGFARHFDHYDDRVDEPEPRRRVWERSAARTTDAALAFVDGRDDPARPLFLWIHYMDPHGPYRAPDAFRGRFEPPPGPPIAIEPARMIARYLVEPGLSDARAYVDRYDEEIAYTDAEIGRLLDGLDRRLGLDGALVALTADHGESMTDHNYWFTHGYQVYEELVRVPLALRAPGVASARSRALVSGVDLAPTILRFAGVPVPPALRGVDLLAPGRIEDDRVVFVETTMQEGQFRGAISRDRKAVVVLEGPDRRFVKQWSHDLANDPGELQRLPRSRADALHDRLEALVARDPDPSGIADDLRRGERLTAPKVAPGVDAESLERLRSLGYAD